MQQPPVSDSSCGYARETTNSGRVYAEGASSLCRSLSSLRCSLAAEARAPCRRRKRADQPARSTNGQR
jgi:hypothetical protein